MPFNEKLGHVQSDQFYAHLITHFNKHEGEKLVPSKCKHCQKCILHVRYMRSHLILDHNCTHSLNNHVEDEVSEQEERPNRVGRPRKPRRADSVDSMPPVLSAASKHTEAARKEAAATSSSKYKLRERSATTNTRLSLRHTAPAVENGIATRKRRRSVASIDDMEKTEKTAVIKDQYEFKDDSETDDDEYGGSKIGEQINSLKKESFNSGKRPARTTGKNSDELFEFD